MTPSSRTLPWDWYAGTIPDNVDLDPTAYLETSFSFHGYRSQAPVGVSIGRGASVYLGTMFDLGPCARVAIGEYALVNGARIICDDAVTIGDHALISWNVVLMDTYRLPMGRDERRRELERIAKSSSRCLDGRVRGKAIRIARNVWVGFDACILPGVTIGEGAIVAARSVVASDVEAYTIVAGNPARPVRKLERMGEMPCS